MPSLLCTVSSCRYNDEKLCSLNTIDVSGGATKENTCCSSFSEASGSSNCTGCGTSETSIYCQAHDCTHNGNSTCHADSVDVCSDGHACECKETACNTYAQA
ncbi:DUF1540 domain-containing protein [Anaerosporobacter sp.]|uniref:DUF1540 domain-containing protein n=1 Tax=Anaerosporobacter sp. TaxID=1872529 RepID=UPI00286FAB1D|nr:DUF1540 domain-containing protein [Anaerosporobacter sp.]